MIRTPIETTSPEYDAFLETKPTPGTHTDVVEVPEGEIELPDRKVLKDTRKMPKPTKRARMKPSKGEIALQDRAYDLRCKGLSWEEIKKELKLTGLNQTWMLVGRHCSRTGDPKPGVVSKDRSVHRSVKAQAEPEISPEPEKAVEEEPEPENEPISSVEILSDGFEKTSSDQKYLARVNVGGREYAFGYAEKPTEREVMKAVERQRRSE